MTDTVIEGGLQIAAPLHAFITTDVLPGTGIAPVALWSGLETLLNDLAPRNRALLARRDQLQAAIDAWHAERRGKVFDAAAYKAFLGDIGYLLPEGPEFRIRTEGVDREIAAIAGPQLVVPVTNARYALNAANARWGSLYDALYGTDALPEDGGAVRGSGYNPLRGARVIDFARGFLDAMAPLAAGSHRQATGYRVVDGRLLAGEVGLAQPERFAGYQGEAAAPTVLLLVHHGLHVEIHIDRTHPIGRDDPAGICDLVLESAVTTIVDLEDSVAVVDAEDMAAALRNWLGLMKGDLEADFPKGGRSVRRRLNADRVYTAAGGGR